MFNKTKTFLEDANCIVFLGFAYHDLNMEFIKIDSPKADCDIFGTVCDLSKFDKEIVHSKLSSTFGLNNNINLIDDKCGPMLNAISRSLKS